MGPRPSECNQLTAACKADGEMGTGSEQSVCLASSAILLNENEPALRGREGRGL